MKHVSRAEAKIKIKSHGIEEGYRKYPNKE